MSRYAKRAVQQVEGLEVGRPPALKVRTQDEIGGSMMIICPNVAEFRAEEDKKTGAIKRRWSSTVIGLSGKRYEGNQKDGYELVTVDAPVALTLYMSAGAATQFKAIQESAEKGLPIIAVTPRKNRQEFESGIILSGTTEMSDESVDAALEAAGQIIPQDDNEFDL